MEYLIHTYNQAKRLIYIVFGFTLLLIGILMIVFPGPALIVIPISLAILGTEYLWARQLLRRFKSEFNSIKRKASSYFKK